MESPTYLMKNKKQQKGQPPVIIVLLLGSVLNEVMY